MLVKAYFIDGKTSKRRECELTFLQDCTSISYVDDNLNKKTSIWKIEGILKLDVRTTSRTLKYGDFPHEVLEFHNDESFDTFIQRYPEALFHQSTYNKFTTFGWKGIVVAAVSVVVVSALFFLYGTPFLAEGIAKSIPKEYETSIGENFQQTYLQLLTVDSTKTVYMQSFYNDLGYKSEYDVSVVVVESDIVNAFALPGGFIVVYSGILDLIESEEELAALLAHEASHINGRHSLRLMSRELAMYLLLASLTGDVGGFSAVLIENSNMISSLSFSREFEKEADLKGFDLMVESQLNPKGMVGLFEKLGSLTDSIENKIVKKLNLDSTLVNTSLDSTNLWKDIPWKKASEILSTHPAPKNRINYLKDEILKVNSSTQFFVSDTLRHYFRELKSY
ncbi:MAG: Zn-dependent protease with chaperone function [Urechidicola sp.]|jgi:Zn-dependent protease with chaperone function